MAGQLHNTTNNLFTQFSYIAGLHHHLPASIVTFRLPWDETCPQGGQIQYGGIRKQVDVVLLLKTRRYAAN